MKAHKLTGECSVCGTETRSLGFRVFVCKACAMFYRRSFRSRGHLKCTGSGNCQMTGAQRSNCRHCRLERCRAVGLRMHHSSLVIQHLGFPEDDVYEEELPLPPAADQSTSASSQPPNPPAGVPICPPIDPNAFDESAFPLLHAAARMVQRFEVRQRALADSFRSSEECAGGLASQSINIDNVRYLRTESGSLHLLSVTIAELLKEACGEFVQVSPSAVVELSLLHKLCLAVRQFPQKADPRIALFFGAHADTNDLRLHLGSKYEERKNFVGPLWRTWVESRERFKNVNPTAAESAILVVVFVLEAADRHQPLNERGDRWRTAISAEIYAFLTRLHGPLAAAPRLIRLLALQMDSKQLYFDYQEMWQVVRVFLPNFAEYRWDERVAQCDMSFINEYQTIAMEITKK